MIDKQKVMQQAMQETVSVEYTQLAYYQDKVPLDKLQEWHRKEYQEELDMADAREVYLAACQYCAAERQPAAYAYDDAMPAPEDEEQEDD